MQALDQFYGTPGLLPALWELAVGDPSQFKEQYRRYMVLEAEAVSLWHYSSSSPPGLLQTAGYAREALAVGWIESAELEQQVEARVGRRQLLEGDDPPMFRVILSSTGSSADARLRPRTSTTPWVSGNPATGRLRHLAALGVTGREPSFHAAQLPLPTKPFRLEPTGLTAVGEDARTWPEIARVFL